MYGLGRIAKTDSQLYYLADGLRSAHSRNMMEWWADR